MRNLVDGSEVVSNRDINASRSLSEAYPALRPLIENSAISEVFRRHNVAAMHWKLVYERFGRAGLVCVLLAMLVVDYQITLQPFYLRIAFLNILGSVLAGLGLSSQLYLLISNAKEKWITQRFIAERLRCIKFQAFALLASCPNPESLRLRVAAWSSEALAALEQETLGGRSAVREFSPSEVSIPAERPIEHLDLALLADATKLYDSLRLSVQAQHFAEQCRLAENRAMWPEVLSELCFGVGALLAFVQILVAGWTDFAVHATRNPGNWSGWLAFSTLLLFIVSAVVAVYQRGSGHQPDAERYLAYLREVRRIRMLSAQGNEHSLFQTVKDMEEIALRELHDFCRDSRHSNYIF